MASTGVVISVESYFSLIDKWRVMWPIFGAANQLIASLTLILISAWLLSEGKNYKIAFSSGLFMMGITIFALLVEMPHFFHKENYAFRVASAVPIVLGLFTLREFKRVANVV